MNWKRFIITNLGGYETIADAIDAIKEKNLSERTLILTLAVKRFYNTISAEDILREVNGTWLYQDKPLPDEMKKVLIAEAKQMTQMTLWKILQQDIKYQANKRMFLLAENEEHLNAGKMWTYVLDAMNTRLNSLSKGLGYFHLKNP